MRHLAFGHRASGLVRICTASCTPGLALVVFTLCFPLIADIPQELNLGSLHLHNSLYLPTLNILNNPKLELTFSMSTNPKNQKDALMSGPTFCCLITV